MGSMLAAGAGMVLTLEGPTSTGSGHHPLADHRRLAVVMGTGGRHKGGKGCGRRVGMRVGMPYAR